MVTVVNKLRLKANKNCIGWGKGLSPHAE